MPRSSSILLFCILASFAGHVIAASESWSATVPPDAIVLLDEHGPGGFVSKRGDQVDWKLADATLTVTNGETRSNHIVSRLHFRDAEIHAEFKLPPAGSGNSGIYIHGNYEFQIFNSHHKQMLDDSDAGAIYGFAPPLVKATRPPGEWQVVDIRYRAPRRNDAGAIVEPGRISAWLNGERVQDETPVGEPRSTYHPFRYNTTDYLRQINQRMALTSTGPVFLQDHDNPVAFRNVWVRPLDDQAFWYQPTSGPVAATREARRPNILIAISDDQSWPHASAYGDPTARTPNFDRVAREGVLFTHAFCASPGCSPCRAALLTGRHPWQLEHAGTHGSDFPLRYTTYPEQLEKNGYFVGFTGKGWGPGKYEPMGRTRNPAGTEFRPADESVQTPGYVASFANFLDKRPEGSPFCFWFGSKDPHRSYELGSGVASGRELSEVVVPPFLPDHPIVRSDLLDYAFEVERFDHDLGGILRLLEQRGELENTLVIVTSDNGMPFPRAKANCYEYGIHMPLAIRWGTTVPAGRVVDDLVGFVDLTATIYQATRVEPPAPAALAGRSLLPILKSPLTGVVEPRRDAVYVARERHSSSRFHSLGYPQRGIRTRDYLYIRNFRPERWPAGAPQKLADGRNYPASNAGLGPMHAAYHDIDSSPTLTLLADNADDSELGRYLELAVGHRPAEELFDIRKDPGCLRNLADVPAFDSVRSQLAERLDAKLRETGDPRVVAADGGDIFETYQRYADVRWFPVPDWAKKPGVILPKQPWLEKRH